MERIKYVCLERVPERITIKQFADLIGVSKSTAYRIADSGNIKCSRISKRRRIIFKDDFLKWFERYSDGGDSS